MTTYRFLDDAQRELTPGCVVQAHAIVQRTTSEIETLRSELGRQTSTRLIRQCDEQTVAGLAAVLAAARKACLNASEFSQWGVVAAPKHLGRVSAAITLKRHRRKGMAAVSPTILPQHSLHSVSGTISIALGIHGPNYGVGGGCGALGEGLLCAVALMADGSLPGIWLVLTEWNPEPIPDEGNPHDVGDAMCHGLAIALSCRHQQDKSQLLRAFPGDSSAISVVSPPVLSDQTTVIELAKMLDIEYQNRSNEHRSQLATRSTANECDDRKAA